MRIVPDGGERWFEMESTNKTLLNADSVTLAEAAAAVLIEKKAIDVRLYNVGEENPITTFCLFSHLL